MPENTQPARPGTMPATRDIDREDDVDAWGNESTSDTMGGLVHDVLHALVEAGTGVAVDVEVVGEGAIVIRGEAPTMAVRDRIAQVASGVDGVTEVRNEMSIAASAAPANR